MTSVVVRMIREFLRELLVIWNASQQAGVRTRLFLLGLASENHSGVLSVAKKDFLDVRRAKIVWFVGGIYVLIAMLLFYDAQRGVAEPDILAGFLQITVIGALLIPLIALVSAYLAIAGERESGSIKYLLSLPNTRSDVVLGKYLSRATVVSASILLAFFITALFALFWYPSLEARAFLIITLLTLLYALTYVAIAIGISAATASRSRAMGVSIAFYFITNVLVLFDEISISAMLDFLLNSVLSLDVSENALEFVNSMSPTWAFVNATQLAFPDDFPHPQAIEDAPLYLEPWVMVLLMLAWLVVPVLLGLYWFTQADLG